MATFVFPSEYAMLPGTPGVELEDAAHVMVVGAGRNGDGTGVNPRGIQRLVTGACFFAERNLSAADGRFLCSSYKTPADTNGELWHLPEDDPTEPQWPTGDSGLRTEFIGTPEAYSFHTLLEGISKALTAKYGRGIPRSQRRLDPVTFDTTTNFAWAEARAAAIFGNEDKRPVAIVAQSEGHLERSLWDASKTFHRPYVGLVAPQVEGAVLHESRTPRAFGQLALLGLDKDRLSPDELYTKLSRRVDRRWRSILWVSDRKPGKRPSYNTFGDNSAVALID